MPKYYCDYCDIFLTHDSINVRKAHNAGWKHRMQVQNYYSALSQDKVEDVLNQIAKAYEGRTDGIPSGPKVFGQPQQLPYMQNIQRPGMPLGAPYGLPPSSGPVAFQQPPIITHPIPVAPMISNPTGTPARPKIPPPPSFRPPPRVQMPLPPKRTFQSSSDDPSKRLKDV